MLAVGVEYIGCRGLWEVSSLTSCSQEVQLENVAQGLNQSCCEHLQGELPQLLWVASSSVCPPL